MKIFNRQWTRNDANGTERASRSFKQAGRLLCIPALLLCGSASAQTAMELFNPAAREYIVGNTAVASNLVSSALTKYPDDEKLQKLKELIEQQQEQQDQNQQNQDQQNQDQQNQDQQSQDQQNQNQQDQQQDQSDEQKQQEEQQPSQEEQEQEPQQAQPSQAQQQAGEMSEEEAQQLLDSMKLNEKDQRTDLRPFLGQPVKVDKDW